MEPIIFKKLDPEGDNRETFKYLFKVAHMNYYVLDCNVTSVYKYMQEITTVENSTEYRVCILTFNYNNCYGPAAVRMRSCPLFLICMGK